MNAGTSFLAEGNGRVVLALLAGIAVWLVCLAGASKATAADEVVSAGNFATVWHGSNSSERMGDIVANAGDVNGDGVDDYLTKVDGAANRGVFVLFGPGRPDSPDLANLDPSDGYRIQTASDAVWVAPVGDQNDDDVPDMVLAEGSTGLSGIVTVVYGVSDPGTDLAQCNAPDSTRCVATADPVDVSDERLGFRVTDSVSLVSSAGLWASGDFDGDGKDELLAPTGKTGNDGVKALVLAHDLGSKCAATPGLCTLDLSTLSAPDVVEIGGLPASIPVGNSVDAPGDVNGDGHDDVVLTSGTDGSAQPTGWVLYGQGWTTSPVNLSDLTSVNGFKIGLPFSALISFAFSPGDVNGDGLPDIGVQAAEVVPALATSFTVIYGQTGTPERNPATDPPAVGEGVQFDWDSGFTPAPIQGSTSGNLPVSLGDLNGDGADEFGATAPNAQIDGKSNAGRVSIFQGGVPADQNLVTVDGTTMPDKVLMLGGDTASLRLGTGLAPAGDIDGDGASDLAIGGSGFALTSPSPVSNAGMVGILSSAQFYPGAATGVAGSVDMTSADLGGVANANRRESNAHFEYGTTTDYGEETAPQAVGHASVGRAFDAKAGGLQANTEYHYRAVIENDLGIKSYGQDRTFKTAAKPVNPCDADPTAPGCSKGPSTGMEFCEAHPADPICQPDKTAPGLSDLIANSRSAKVRRGKKAVVWAWITSTGTARADGVKVCANVPKRKAKVAGKRCRTVGSLEPGKTAKVKFKIKAKARKGAKVKVKLIASGKGVSNNRTAKVRFTVR